MARAGTCRARPGTLAQLLMKRAYHLARLSLQSVRRIQETPAAQAADSSFRSVMRLGPEIESAAR